MAIPPRCQPGLSILCENSLAVPVWGTRSSRAREAPVYGPARTRLRTMLTHEGLPAGNAYLAQQRPTGTRTPRVQERDSPQFCAPRRATPRSGQACHSTRCAPGGISRRARSSGACGRQLLREHAVSHLSGAHARERAALPAPPSASALDANAAAALPPPALLPALLAPLVAELLPLLPRRPRAEGRPLLAPVP